MLTIFLKNSINCSVLSPLIVDLQTLYIAKSLFLDSRFKAIHGMHPTREERLVIPCERIFFIIGRDKSQRSFDTI